MPGPPPLPDKPPLTGCPATLLLMVSVAVATLAGGLALTMLVFG